MYNFEINQIQFNTVDGFDIKDFSFKNGTDTVVLTVGNVNIDATIDGMASCLWLIKGHLEAFTIKNLTIKVEISIDSQD